jgi:hypothetical protein
MITLQISAKSRFLICFLLTMLLSITWIGYSVAVPASPQPQPAYQEQFFRYLNDQKYTLSLGEDRGACDYSIDPTDVYEQSGNRFVTAKVSRGMGGTACRGVLAFNILHADCQAQKLYEFQRDTDREGRLRGWQHLEKSLVKYMPPNLSNPTRLTSADLAAQVCALSVRSSAEAASL